MAFRLSGMPPFIRKKALRDAEGFCNEAAVLWVVQEFELVRDKIPLVPDKCRLVQDNSLEMLVKIRILPVKKILTPDNEKNSCHPKWFSFYPAYSLAPQLTDLLLLASTSCLHGSQ